MPSKRVSLKGKGADLFFGDYAPATQPSSSEDGNSSPPISTDVTPTPRQPRLSSDSKDVDLHGDLTSPSTPSRRSPRQQASLQASLPSRVPAEILASKRAANAVTEQADIVAAIRKIVKIPGKEVSYIRLTPEEKAQIADIVYAFKRQGQKTTENEIHRIALNHLLNDYHERGEHSVLALVLAALLA